MDIFENWATKIRSQRWRLNSYQWLALSFATLILLGAVVLTLPVASADGRGLGFVDALFTATSAVCVTGLVVVDTGTFFSGFGQMVILALIQLGGLGIMTIATLLAVLTGKRINLRERLLIQEATNQLGLSGVVRLTLYIIRTTLFIEFIGGTLLAIRLYADYGMKGIYLGYWHAVSAFCNAGFDLFGGYQSITRYADDVSVNAIIAPLIIFGGIGFPVIADIWNVRKFSKFTLHSKIVISTSAVLILAGAIVIYLSELKNPATLGQMHWFDQWMSSLFTSITARTAGFNTLDTSSFREGTLFFIVLLMFIGASPSSMGGGIKTTTAAVLVIGLISMLKGEREPNMFYRQIPLVTLHKAFSLLLISAILIGGVTLALSFSEQATLIQVLFETASAFGTVGLSTGITPSLTDFGKMLVILTMFAGRVGTLTLLLAVAFRESRNSIRYPVGKIILG